ncbi:MAG: S8 family serine peptidase, partial [Lacisediminihabitans sp.]
MPRLLHLPSHVVRPRQRSMIVAGMALAALVGATLSAPIAASAAQPGGSDTPVVRTAPAKPIDESTPSDPKAGRYVVILRDEPAASYSGGTGKYAATDASGSRRFAPNAARTIDYATYLTAQQREVSASVKTHPIAQYTLTTNGFAADLSAAQAKKLTADPRVSRLVPNEILHVTDENTSTGYLGLEGENGVWAGVGGASKAGKGVVVGVIDTGIAPENPSFAGDPLGTADGAAPYRDGTSTTFHKSDGTDFHGSCVSGVQFTLADCSTKIISARFFVDGFGKDKIGTTETGEYLSPRDGVGHGSHTASTAAGNGGITAEGHGSTISGVAPAAKIAAYKVCWAGPNPASEDDDGCATTDLLAAIDAATADGVDVINYSIGGGSAESTDSVTDQAFMRAAAAGIFVAASAGNSGPAASTLDNASPWITTVAASTIPAAEATVRFGDGSTALGASVTVPTAGLTGRLVYGKDVALSGATTPERCAAGSLDPELAAGAIVLCDRGGETARLERSAEVKRVGGIGMILANPTHDSTDLDAHAVPTIHVDSQFSAAIHAYAQAHKKDATASFELGNTTGHGSVPSPQVAGFSSRGPVLADGSDLIKPDVAAPGVNILAAVNNAEGASPAWGFMSGTSMASPHIAGLAALYLGQKPKASPAEIKSALMTTAVDTVDDSGAAVPDPFAQGNGQVVPRNYLTPGLLYLNDVDDWNGYLQGIGEQKNVEPIDGSDLNLPSIGIGGLAGTQTVTRTVTATAAGDYSAEISGLAGVTATVSPTTLHFDGAGDTAKFTVTFTRTSAALGAFSTGYLTWKSAAVTVRSALAVQPVAFDVPKEVSGSGAAGTAQIPAKVGADGDVVLSTSGLAHGQRVDGTAIVGGVSDRFAITVPEGAIYARFSLDAADDSADLDLVGYSMTRSGGLNEAGVSATGSADEQFDVLYPSAGTYMIDVSAFAAGVDQSTKQKYTLTSYVMTDTPDAAFSVTPGTIHGRTGDSVAVAAAWEDLPPGSYLGRVTFGTTDLATFVTIDAGEDVPAKAGTPALTVGPEWVRYGANLRMTATGLVPGDEYTASVATIGDVRTGIVPASGVIDWFVAIPKGLANGAHEITLTNGTVTLTAPFKVTPVQIVGADAITSRSFDGTPSARIAASYRGHGTVRFQLSSKDTKEVFLDEQIKLGELAGVDLWGADSTTVKLAPGIIEGTVTVVLDDGSDGPTFTMDPIEVTATQPGTITFQPTAANANLIDVTTENYSGSDLTSIVRYYGHDGRQVFADDYIASGSHTAQIDMTGFTKLDIVDWMGVKLASFANSAPGRSDVAHVHITQNYWATLTASPEKDAARPITVETSFRYPANTLGFDLLVGEGELQSTDPFFSEEIPVVKVTEPGPVVTRTMSARENTRLWVSSNYEISTPYYVAIATANLDIPALKLAELAPTTDPTDPT